MWQGRDNRRGIQGKLIILDSGQDKEVKDGNNNKLYYKKSKPFIIKVSLYVTMLK